MLNQEKKRRPGRPKSSNPASFNLPVVRVRKDRLEAYRGAAKRKEMTFSDWARNALDNAIEADQ